MSFKLNTSPERRREIQEAKKLRHQLFMNDVAEAFWKVLQEYTTQYSKGVDRIHEVDEDIIQGAIESFISNSKYAIIPKEADDDVIYSMEGLTDLMHMYEHATRKDARDEMKIAYDVLVGQYTGEDVGFTIKHINEEN